MFIDSLRTRSLRGRMPSMLRPRLTITVSPSKRWMLPLMISPMRCSYSS
jgi:hypothetical protein